MRRVAKLRWAFGVAVVGVVAAGTLVSVRQQQRSELMRRNFALLRLDVKRHGGLTDGSARRVGVGGVVTSKDGRVSIRVRAISAARVETAVSVGSDGPEAIALPAPGAPVETIELPGGYSVRVLEIDGTRAFITVQGPRRN